MARNLLFVLAALVAQECSAAPVVQRDQDIDLPTSLPTFLSLTDFPTSLLPLPTGASEAKEERAITLTDLTSLSISIPTSLTISIPTLTSIPSLSLTIPTLTSTPSLSISIPTSLTLSIPTLTSIPSLSSLTISLKDRQEESTETPSIPIATATGLPTEPLTPPAFSSGLPTGIPSGFPSGAPTGLPPSPTGTYKVPGGLMRPGRA